MASDSHTPEQLGRYSKAKSYGVLILACGFVLWRIYDPQGELLCTLAVTETTQDQVDRLVDTLNGERSTQLAAL